MDEVLSNEEYRTIRREYDENTETWYFSVIDVVAVLTDQSDPQRARKYWNKLKERLVQEGSQTVTNCHRLKLIAQDGRKRFTDVADAETMLRIVQSIPSPKAEPVKMWLARVGSERIREMSDPEISVNRAIEEWRRHGRSEEWIQRRMFGQETRNKLTKYWKDHKVSENRDFAILTDIIHQAWSDRTVREHKALKGLKTQNLRDHMTEAELIFTALAELSTRQIAESQNAEGVPENAVAAREGGSVARNARIELEARTGRKVVSGSNFIEHK